MPFKELTNGDDVYTGTAEVDHVYAYAGNDIVHGAGGDDHIYGYDGNDTLYGDDGHDEIEGGYGNDVLYGGSGDDSLAGDFFAPNSSIIYQNTNYLYGGAGDDRYLVIGPNDIIDESVAGSDGYDTINTHISFSLASPSVKGTIEVLKLYGDNNLNGTGNAVNNRIYGNPGDNVLDGGAGDDEIHGNAGNDTVIGGEGDDMLLGDDVFINGPLGDDRIYGNAGNDRLLAQQGNDYLDGGTGIDKLEGGTGNDSYVVDNAGDQVIEANGAGADSIYSSVSYSIATQFVENINLTGSANINASGNVLANAITGNSGNNILNGGVAGDYMAGGLGDDTYYVDEAGDTTIEANGAGSDKVFSSISYSVATQFIENVYLTGSAHINATGNNLSNGIVGNSGNNVINGGTGADYMAGGLGDDTYYVDNAGDQTIEANGGGSDKVYSSISCSIATQFVENMYLTGSGNINATGNNLANGIVGNSGNNAIDGRTGADYMVGGLGNDTYYVDNAGDQTIEANGGGSDKVFSSVSYSVSRQFIENVYLTGSSHINATGNNLANGMVGNSGNNVLNGGLGSDYLVGGAGNDFFMFNTALGVSNVDTIKDFSVAQDTIRADNAIFTGLGGAGALAASAFHAGAAAHDADDRIIYNSSTGALYYDADGSGSGASVQFATLSKGLAMTNADVLVV